MFGCMTFISHTEICQKVRISLGKIGFMDTHSHFLPSDFAALLITVDCRISVAGPLSRRFDDISCNFALADELFSHLLFTNHNWVKNQTTLKLSSSDRTYRLVYAS